MKEDRFAAQRSTVAPDTWLVLDTVTRSFAKKPGGRPWRYDTEDQAARKALALNRAYRRSLKIGSVR